MELDLVGAFTASNHINKCKIIIVGSATKKAINWVT